MLLGSMAVFLAATSSLYQSGETCLISQAECRGQHHLLDLGRGYYPRYHSSINCASHNCLPYTCTSRIYKIKVLKRRGIEDVIPDGSLPETLRESWKFVHVQVPVACICSIYNQQTE